MLLAHGTRQMENTEFILLLCSVVLGNASFSFVLLLIDDWQLAVLTKVFFAKQPV